MKITSKRVGIFGPIYDQFQKQPKLAIKHLLKVQNGECPKALYRDDIGFIDIVWGENDPKTNKGYGLKVSTPSRPYCGVGKEGVILRQKKRNVHGKQTQTYAQHRGGALQPGRDMV